MNEVTESNLKKINLKLKTQEKQLQVVQALISRSNGYTKVQAQAGEKRLLKEITVLKADLQKIEGSSKKKTNKDK